MINGITEKEEKIIKNILSNYPYEFYYYGSRVKGDFTKGSDLDVLIKNENEIEQNILDEISLKFNESLIPYRVNCSDYKKMSDNFYNLIKNDLVKVL